MTDLTKISGSQKHRLAISELVTASAIVFLLAAVQGMYASDEAITPLARYDHRACVGLNNQFHSTS